MARPAIYFTTDEECTCGRRRSTTADLARWRAWVFDNRFPGGMGPYGTGAPTRDPSPPDPGWSRVICWASGPSTCQMKPLE